MAIIKRIFLFSAIAAFGGCSSSRPADTPRPDNLLDIYFLTHAKPDIHSDLDILRIRDCRYLGKCISKDGTCFEFLYFSFLFNPGAIDNSRGQERILVFINSDSYVGAFISDEFLLPNICYADGKNLVVCSERGEIERISFENGCPGERKGARILFDFDIQK